MAMADHSSWLANCCIVSHQKLDYLYTYIYDHKDNQNTFKSSLEETTPQL